MAGQAQGGALNSGFGFRVNGFKFEVRVPGLDQGSVQRHRLPASSKRAPASGRGSVFARSCQVQGGEGGLKVCHHSPTLHLSPLPHRRCAACRQAA